MKLFLFMITVIDSPTYSFGLVLCFLLFYLLIISQKFILLYENLNHKNSCILLNAVSAFLANFPVLQTTKRAYHAVYFSACGLLWLSFQWLFCFQPAFIIVSRKPNLEKRLTKLEVIFAIRNFLYLNMVWPINSNSKQISKFIRPTIYILHAVMGFRVYICVYPEKVKN